VLGVDAVDRGERAAEDVVKATELARPLDREEVDGLLHDTDERVIAPCIAADRAGLFLREIAALVAEPNPFLDVLDRRGERERFVLWPLEQVKRQPVGRARADAGKAGELRDQILDGGAQHLSYCADMPRISEVALFTEDVSRLADFYEQLLGRPAESRSDSHASFDLGGTTLFIHVDGDGADHEGAPNGDHVAFALDQDAAAERARSAGTKVVGPKDFYWGRSAYLRDPDGRAVELQAES
jgi:predicted enzyme related to lactoylglutathione lyase